MKLLVCIKQVPDMESKFKIDSDGLWYDRSDLAWRMNEYDEYGVEQAVRVKEQSGGDLTVLCIGPDRVKETMKKALAMGCDRGVHLADDSVHRRDPLVIANHIADFARDMGFELIFCGMQSQDRGSGQVGPMVAELLGMTAVTTVVDFVLDGRAVTVKRELEGGVRMVVGDRFADPCYLPAGPQYPPLPDPAEYHEGQEEGAADYTGCADLLAGHRNQADGAAGEEGRGPLPGRRCRRDRRTTHQNTQGKDRPSGLGESK